MAIPVVEFSREGYKIRIVFCYQNCSDLLREKKFLVTEKNFWNSRPKICKKKLPVNMKLSLNGACMRKAACVENQNHSHSSLYS